MERPMRRTYAIALATGLAAAVGFPATSLALIGCAPGQTVVDTEGGITGVIAGGEDDLCMVKYGMGQTEVWIPASSLSVPTARFVGQTALLPSGGTGSSIPNDDGHADAPVHRRR